MFYALNDIYKVALHSDFLKQKIFSEEIKGKPTELEQEKENAIMVINFIRFIERINLSNAFYQSNF